MSTDLCGGGVECPFQGSLEMVRTVGEVDHLEVDNTSCITFILGILLGKPWRNCCSSLGLFVFVGAAGVADGAAAVSLMGMALECPLTLSEVIWLLV